MVDVADANRLENMARGLQKSKADGGLLADDSALNRVFKFVVPFDSAEAPQGAVKSVGEVLFNSESPAT